MCIFFIARVKKGMFIIVKKLYMKQIISFFFVTVLVSVNLQAQTFAGGTGSQADPYQISTVEQLNNVRDYLDSSFILINDIDLGVSPYDSGDGWEPIGTSTFPFTGNFNGAGYSINNLYINRGATSSVGMFSAASGAVIDSLKILDCSVNGMSSTGGLAGRSVSSTISDCSVSGKIETVTGITIGGLIGYVSTSYISDCYFTGEVISNNSGVGGLVGINTTNSTISECYVTGTVSGTSEIGGLVGSHSTSSVISDCYVIGEVSGTSSVGGLIGISTSSTTSGCHTSGTVSGTDNIGGLTGRNFSTSAITGCYSNAEISGTDNIGGLAGWNNSSSTISECYFTGNISGNGFNGGIAGQNTSSSTITNCYATGEVSGTGYYNGGVVGYCSSSSISNCYAIGKVSGMGSYICGVVGRNISSTITNSYYNTETSGTSDTYATGLTTAQMKQQSNFTGFDFSTIWTITNGKTFPRIQTVNNAPIILPVLSTIYKIDSMTTDTIQLIHMDYDPVTISLESAPSGMQLRDSIISWTPNDGGIFDITVKALNSNGAFSTYSVIVVVTPNGEGTKENPYQITTIGELCILRELPDSNYILMNDLDFSGSIYDSDNSTEGWEPIGTDESPFTGSINGTAHIISNLYINRPSSDYTGLFGYTDGAVIDSLGIPDCYITGNSNTGCLAGYSELSTISNCFVTGKVTGTGNNIGGMVGNNYSSDMFNCYATGDVSGSGYYTGGLTGRNYMTSSISDCYATGNVSGNNYAGGLVGWNYSSDISRCYSTGNVPGTGSYFGGLVGFNSSSTINNSYYNTETSGQSDANGTGLTTLQMKQQSSFTGFDFNTIWAIRSDSTYPALLKLDNAPFALPDTINNAAKSEKLDILLENDYDYETLQDNLIVEVIAIDSGYVANNIIYFKENANGGDTLNITYRVGEVKITRADTLWGNSSSSLLIRNHTPELTAVSNTSIPEDVPVTLSVNDVTASDIDGDALLLIVNNGDNYTVTNSMVTPAADFNGMLTVPVSVTDGTDTSIVMNLSITVTPVNDAPVLTAVNNTSTAEDTPITLSVSDVTASDVDGDILTLIAYAGDNYSVNGVVITPASNYNGIIMVPVAVTDGNDTSNIMNMNITVGAGVGINHILAGNISVYPNPVKDKLFIQGIRETTTLEIRNINGQVIYAGNISEGEAIDVSYLPEGIYCVILKYYGIQEKIIINQP